jgi:hypothetical protein
MDILIFSFKNTSSVCWVGPFRKRDSSALGYLSHALEI